MAYHALSFHGKEEPEMIDGFTGDQRFFLSFAKMWRESDTNESLRTLASVEYSLARQIQGQRRGL